MDAQLLFNILLGSAGTLAGWFFKVLYDQLKEVQEEVSDLEDKHESDHRLMQDRLSDLALSLPEKYVNKGDFETLTKVMHHRFDKLEEKLDALKN
jgi:HEPN domain-containing protein